MSEETRKKMGDARRGERNGRYGKPGTMFGRRGEAAPAWKGADANYATIHEWVRKWWPKSGVCDECGKEAKTDWANISGEYRRDDRSDWRELCKSCHAKFDDWGARLRSYAKRRAPA